MPHQPHPPPLAPLQIPGGSLPRTMDVILRNNAVEQARAGDRMVFTGCLIVAPDVGAMAAPGEKVVMRTGAGLDLLH